MLLAYMNGSKGPCSLLVRERVRNRETEVLVCGYPGGGGAEYRLVCIKGFVNWGGREHWMCSTSCACSLNY